VNFSSFRFWSRASSIYVSHWKLKRLCTSVSLR